MDHTFTFRLSFLLYWNCIFPKLVISRDRWAGYVLFSVLNGKFEIAVQECDENWWIKFF
jgi:hypothetical protein